MPLFFKDILAVLGFYKTAILLEDNDWTAYHYIHFLNLFRILDTRKTTKPLSKNKDLILNSLDLNGAPIRIALSGSRYIPMFITLPKIPRNKLDQAVSTEIEKLLPLPLQDVFFQYKVISNNKSGPLEQWNILAVCSRKSDHEYALRIFSDLNIPIEDSFYLPPHAFSFIMQPLKPLMGLVVLGQQNAMVTTMVHNKPNSFNLQYGSFKKMNTVEANNIVRFISQNLPKGSSSPEIRILNQIENEPKTLLKSIREFFGVDAKVLNPDNIGSKKKPGQEDAVPLSLSGYFKNSGSVFHISMKSKEFKLNPWIVYKLGLIIILLLFLVSLLFLPMVVSTLSEYNLYQRARVMDPATSADRRLLLLHEDILRSEQILRLKRDENDLVIKISILKNQRLRPSNRHLLLGEIALYIPKDIRLKKFLVAHEKVILEGSSLSAESVHSFVKNISSSVLVRNAVLTRTETSPTTDGLTTEFILSFEALP